MTVERKSESRNNHQYAVVIQVLAVQWNPWQTKTSQETENNFRKFQEPSQRPKVIHTYQFMRIWQILWRIIMESSSNCTRSITKTSGIAERAVRRAKEETSAVLLQSGSDDKWWSDSMECNCYLRDVEDLLTDGKSQSERRLGESFKDMLCSRCESGNKIFWLLGLKIWKS